MVGWYSLGAYELKNHNLHHANLGMPCYRAELWPFLVTSEKYKSRPGFVLYCGGDRVQRIAVGLVTRWTGLYKDVNPESGCQLLASLHISSRRSITLGFVIFLSLLLSCSPAYNNPFILIGRIRFFFSLRYKSIRHASLKGGHLNSSPTYHTAT